MSTKAKAGVHDSPGPLDTQPNARSLSRAADPEKRFENLRAILALHGLALVRSSDDRDVPIFIVSRWARTRSLENLQAVEAFAARVAPGYFK